MHRENLGVWREPEIGREQEGEGGNPQKASVSARFANELKPRRGRRDKYMFPQHRALIRESARKWSEAEAPDVDVDASLTLDVLCVLDGEH